MGTVISKFVGLKFAHSEKWMIFLKSELYKNNLNKIQVYSDGVKNQQLLVSLLRYLTGRISQLWHGITGVRAFISRTVFFS